MRIDDLNDGQLQINLLTKIRNEHYFIAAIFILAMILIASDKKPIWAVLLVLGFWALSHAGFQVFFRAQENDLYNLMVKKLGLRRRSPL